jgi:CheY-like chemotaxis protein
MKPQEVCALHRKNRYDLILLDLQMRGMAGFQVMEGLKTNDADDYLPVLVITAQSGHKLRALQAGAKDFISKPFDLVKVKTRIHNMLEVRLLYKKLDFKFSRVNADGSHQKFQVSGQPDVRPVLPLHRLPRNRRGAYRKEIERKIPTVSDVIIHSPNQNHLLAALPATEFGRLSPDLVPMPLGEMLYEPGEKMQHA